MFVRLRAFWCLARTLGATERQTWQEINSWVRFCVLDALREIGLFDYLQEPHTFKEICAHFDFTDVDYLTDMLITLVNDKQKPLLLEGDKYRLGAGQKPPIRAQAKPRLSGETMAPRAVADLAREMPKRLRSASTGFVRRMEREQDQRLNFDAMLGSRLFAAIRAAAFLWARPLMGDLEGKTLLDVGCGSGHETAHLWRLTEGKVRITAVDPVSSFVDLACGRFADLIQTSGGKTIPQSSPPECCVMSATHLDFPHHAFDYVFHSAMLPWTSDPQRATAEMLRVLKPGGVIFGVAVTRPAVSDYLDLLLRTDENIYGFFWYDDLIRWHVERGALPEKLSGSIYRARKNR